MPKRALSPVWLGRPSKRVRITGGGGEELSSSVGPNPPSGAYLLQLICEDTITCCTTADASKMGKYMIADVSNHFLSESERSQSYLVVKLSSVVSSRYNVIVYLQKWQSEEAESISIVEVKSATCTCDYTPMTRNYCKHVAATLWSVFINGSRIVDCVHSFTSSISKLSHESLSRCLTELVTARPDISPLLKRLIQKEVASETGFIASLAPPPDESFRLQTNSVVSCGGRKARIFHRSSIRDEIDVDTNQVFSLVHQKLHTFLQNLSRSCEALGGCSCSCHTTMNDVTSCNCTKSDYSSVKSVVNELVINAESYLALKTPVGSANALVLMESLVRGFIVNEFGEGNKENHFHLFTSQKWFSGIRSNFMRNALELLWRLATALVRVDIVSDIRQTIGYSLQHWCQDCLPEFLPFLGELQHAAFDESLGAEDTHQSYPVITAARASELWRNEDREGLKAYWSSAAMPHTFEAFVGHQAPFPELWNRTATYSQIMAQKAP